MINQLQWSLIAMPPIVATFSAPVFILQISEEKSEIRN